jgi:hypothetical protein
MIMPSKVAKPYSKVNRRSLAQELRRDHRGEAADHRRKERARPKTAADNCSARGEQEREPEQPQNLAENSRPLTERGPFG